MTSLSSNIYSLILIYLSSPAGMLKSPVWSEPSSPSVDHTPVQHNCRIKTFLSFESFVIGLSTDAAQICGIPCEPIHERIWERCDRLVHTSTQTHTLENAPLGCHLRLMWQMRRSGISVTGTRCPGLPGARTLTLMQAHTHTHTPFKMKLKWKRSAANHP